MNRYFIIAPLIILSICSTACAMENPSEEEMPKLFHNLPWERDLREIVQNRTNITPKQYERDKENILLYAINQYERENKKELSPEERNELKKIYLENAYLENASKELELKISSKKTKHKNTKKAFMSKSTSDITKPKKKHSKSMLK